MTPGPEAPQAAPEKSLDPAALALAGIVQCAELVHQTATGARVDDEQRRSLLRTIPTHHAEHFADIFPNPNDLRSGAALAALTLAGRGGSPEVLRYTLQLIELANLLQGVPQVVEKLGRLLDQLDRQDPDEADLARIYQQTISTLGKRIQVTGDAALLQRDQTAERIRALLLAGVRMAWLWRQLGGRRWHLIFRRKPVIAALQRITG